MPQGIRGFESHPLRQPVFGSRSTSDCQPFHDAQFTMIDTQLSGKTALITGCNNPNGIGAAVAFALAAQGVKVCAHFFRSTKDTNSDPDKMGEEYYLAQQSKSADWLVARIKSQHGSALSIEADLSDAQVIPGLFDKAEELGPVEIVVNNAACCSQDTLLPTSGESRAVDGFPMQTISPESHDKHFAVNTRATALIMTEFARRHMARKASWGRIVNVSTDGAAAFPTEVSYGASKYAIESFSRSAAKEFGPLGITVNVLSLGPIQTGWIAPELERMITDNTPLGRVGMPPDVADVVVFLSSEQARWLTGQVIYVGGGHKMV
jgi:3-oxoacyl-[acyl-carrier protein] reductase